MIKPMRVAITGAAGSISRSLIFRIASGELFGPEKPVCLQLIEVPQGMDGLKGIAMELEDCAFPLLCGVSLHDNPKDGFLNVDYALLIGAKPRTKGMERRDLLTANAEIFSVQGKALNDYASANVKVLVVGNPANTNALIACKNAPDLPDEQFSALSRLDHNRAVGILATKLQCNPYELENIIIWGNHSPTMFPDVQSANLYNDPVSSLIDQSWYIEEFIPKVQNRGGEIIQACGQSSSASAAQAILDHMCDLIHGSDNDLVSMVVMSDGSYGISSDIFFSYPVRCNYERYKIVQGVDITKLSKEYIKITEDELLEEREAISSLLPKKKVMKSKSSSDESNNLNPYDIYSKFV